MAQQSQYQWLDFAKPTFPYKSYTSPVDESPHFVLGSQNILASQIGYLEKRPGFSQNIGGNQIPGKVVRLFGWRRWSGSFFIMACTIDGGFAKVYKSQDSGTFTLIWTSTSATPFDFVVSDNFCFFGNGTDMRKYDGTTVSKWGTDAPTTAPAISFQNGNLPPGLTFTSNGQVNGTPTVAGSTNIVITATDSAGNVATQSYNLLVQPQTLIFSNPAGFNQQATIGSAYSQAMTGRFGTGGYAVTLFSGSLPPGLSLAGNIISGTPTTAGLYIFALKVTDSSTASFVQSFSIYVSTASAITLTPSTLFTAPIGSPYTDTLTASGGTGPYTFVIQQGLPNNNFTPDGGYPGLPPGITATSTGTTITFSGTPTQIGTYYFYIAIQDSTTLNTRIPMSIQLTVVPGTYALFPNALSNRYGNQNFQNDTYFADFTTSGAVGTETFTISIGSLNAQSGYSWGYSYTTVYGHESNVSPLSPSTGPFTNLDAAVTVIASSDPQVTGINIYRTTDGGTADPAIMRLLTQLTNTNQTFVDGVADEDLGLQTGPGFLINTPPAPTIGFVWSNGRIYGFTMNTTYYSGAEEVSNGIQEECWPSGEDGNFYAWPSEVGGMAVTQNGVDIGLSEQFWQVSGDSLDTFRKSLLLDKAGVRSPPCISAIGNSVQWVDTAKQVWSSSLGEFGEPIRTDLIGIDPNQTFIGYHKSKNYNWIYVLDALNGKLFTYDLDLDQWNTPWTVAATAIWSGETAVGEISLIVSLFGRIMKLVPDTYTDDGAGYEDDIKMNLLPISPGRTTTGRSRIEPTQMEGIAFETNFFAGAPPTPSFVGYLSDDDPILSAQSDWSDVTTFFVTPQYQPQGKTLYVQEYRCDSTTNPAIRAAVWIQFAASLTAWKVYSLTLSWIRA